MANLRRISLGGQIHKWEKTDDEKLSLAFVALVALEHVYNLVLEIFLWTSDRAIKAFGMTLAKAETCKTLAANQGVYNGFLAAGIFWSFTLSDQEALKVRAFFFICVLVAGIYGAATQNRRLF